VPNLVTLGQNGTSIIRDPPKKFYLAHPTFRGHSRSS